MQILSNRGKEGHDGLGDKVVGKTANAVLLESVAIVVE